MKNFNDVENKLLTALKIIMVAFMNDSFNFVITQNQRLIQLETFIDFEISYRKMIFFYRLSDFLIQIRYGCNTMYSYILKPV